MVFQLICWWVSYIFVLASSSWTCEEDLSEVPYFVLNGCQFGCTILCGLVPVCGSAIVWRSSRSPHGFGASLPVAWSHPTLVKYKASCPLFSASCPLFVNLLSWRSGHPCVDSYRHLSCGNQSYCCHGRFCYHPVIYPLFTIYYCFHPSHIFFLSYPTIHQKAIHKKFL